MDYGVISMVWHAILSHIANGSQGSRENSKPVPEEGSEMNKGQKLNLNSDNVKGLLIGFNLTLGSVIRSILDGVSLLLKVHYHNLGVLLDPKLLQNVAVVVAARKAHDQLHLLCQLHAFLDKTDFASYSTHALITPSLQALPELAHLECLGRCGRPGIQS